MWVVACLRVSPVIDHWVVQGVPPCRQTAAKDSSQSQPWTGQPVEKYGRSELSSLSYSPAARIFSQCNSDSPETGKSWKSAQFWHAPEERMMQSIGTSTHLIFLHLMSISTIGLQVIMSTAQLKQTFFGVWPLSRDWSNYLTKKGSLFWEVIWPLIPVLMW